MEKVRRLVQRNRLNWVASIRRAITQRITKGMKERRSLDEDKEEHLPDTRK